MKTFKSSAGEFLQKFISQRTQYSAIWRDFAFKLRKHFDEWLKHLNGDKFENLKELIVTDRIKQNLPYGIQEAFFNDLPRVKNVDVLLNKLDNYETVRCNLKKKARIEVQKNFFLIQIYASMWENQTISLF